MSDVAVTDMARGASKPTPGSGAPGSRGTVQAFWFVVIPAILAIACGWLLPDSARYTGLPEFVSILADSPLAVVVTLFVVFSAITRYWRYYLPGRGALFPLQPSPTVGPETLRVIEPVAELVRSLSNPRRLGRAARQAGQQEESLAEAIAEARQAIEAGNPATVRAAGETLSRLLTPSKAARTAAAIRPMLALVLLVGVAIGTALVLRLTFFEIFRVQSSSMLPTLLPFDRVVVSKSAYGWNLPILGRRDSRLPRRGEVIVFRSHDLTGDRQGPPEAVKRVIGIPGDVISMLNGHAVVNGWTVPTCDAGVYVHPGADGGAVGRMLVEFLDDQVYLTVHAGLSHHFRDPYVVKPGEVFVIGDNRNQSIDSRAWAYGRGAGVPMAAIDGRLTHIIGSDRNGAVDGARLFTRLGLDTPLPGVDTRELRAGIARCLETRPKATTPPPRL